ncbi:MAG: 2-dehydro-3-deoxyglucarate aldolase [Candidatus Latescibacteria bacterium]|nr:2-dehydro-3-deoxyglucarate aldolase [Candidatus Latescibacterota bacterium]
MRQLKRNTVKQKLSEGKAAVGTWLNLASVVVADNLGHVGFDFMVVDMEHSPITQETAFHCLASIAASASTPMARVPWNHPMPIKQALEAGAMGVVVPMVNTPEEAEMAVSAMRFPPGGSRSMGALAIPYGPDYGPRFNEEVCAVVMVEHIEAVKRVEDILKVKGIDVCFIGTGDLALSMGMKIGHPDHEAAVQRILKAGQGAGVPVGLPCATAEDVNRRVGEGFRFIDFTCDLAFLMSAAREGLAKVKR